MRPELETYYQIDRYFRKELHGEELLAFEEKVKLDPDFAKEVQIQGLVNQVVVGAAYEDLRHQMRIELPKISHSTTQWKKWWTWGILLLVGIWIGWIGMKENSSSTPPQLISSPYSKNNDTEERNVQVDNNVAIEDKINVKVKAKPAAIVEVPIPEKTTVKPTNIEATNEEPIVEFKTNLTEAHNHEKVSPPAMSKTEVEVDQPKDEKPDCHHFQVQLSPEITAACAGERNGKVSFDMNNYHGKWKDISISKERNTSHASQTVFYNLAAGDHIFFIHNENGCSTSQKITVPEKNCKPNTFAFNPELGETWKLPVDPQETYTISIHSRGGHLVFRHHTKDGNLAEWTGTSQNSGHLEPGLYIYLIEYSDGRKESGQVSILK